MNKFALSVIILKFNAFVIWLFYKGAMTMIIETIHKFLYFLLNFLSNRLTVQKSHKVLNRPIKYSCESILQLGRYLDYRRDYNPVHFFNYRDKYSKII